MERRFIAGKYARAVLSEYRIPVGSQDIGNRIHHNDTKITKQEDPFSFGVFDDLGANIQLPAPSSQLGSLPCRGVALRVKRDAIDLSDLRNKLVYLGASDVGEEDSVLIRTAAEPFDLLPETLVLSLGFHREGNPLPIVGSKNSLLGLLS